MQVSMSEVSRHNRMDDAWVVLHGVVYDITSYLQYHPGGEEILLECAGQDVTKEFRMFEGFVF